MLKAFRKHIGTKLQMLANSRFLIASSGGIDSVVLTHLCHKLDLNFALAHCNFSLRGLESDADEEFVLDLGDNLGVEVFSQRFDTKQYAESNKLSIQMAARELRYNWFQELASQLDFDFILTAHHADDNLETFLINFTRGTGLNGLTGIPAVNNNVVRPLLPFSRKQIEKFARNNNIVWREDSSNSGRKYLRNKLRHEVIPILKEVNPQLLNSFQNTLLNLNDTADIVDESLNAVAKRAIVDIDENEITYKVSEFKKVNNPKAYLFEMFKDFGFSEWNDVLALLDAETGKYVTSNTYKLTKHRELLILSEINKDAMVQSTVEVSEYDIETNGAVKTFVGELKFTNVDAKNDNAENTIYINADVLQFPLLLRKWQPGDIFYPLGMKGKKKLGKFLKDEKLKPHEKANTWVLISGNDIIWVVGRRADNRFKISPNTKYILKIELIQ